MADIEELVLKVGVEVDSEQLKRLQKEIEKIKTQALKNSVNLGLNTSNSSTSFSGSSNITGNAGNIAGLLSLSEKHLLEMLNILKDSNNRQKRNPEKGSGSNSNGPIPFVNDLMNSNAGTLIGGGAGAALGSLGGPAGTVFGAQLGATIGTIAEKVFDTAHEKMIAVAGLFEKRLTEDLHFRQLSYQTGILREDLALLDKQAKLSGTSLQSLVDSNQSLADELMGGLSAEKTQLLMALNINPRQLLLESGGDFGKINQMIYQRATKALQGANPYQRTHYLKELGFSEDMQNSRRFLYNEDVVNRSKEIVNRETNNGKTPYVTGAALQKENLDYFGGKLDVQAGIRAALTTAGLAGKLSTELMQVQAKVVNIIATAISGIGGENSDTAKSIEKNKYYQTSPNGVLDSVWDYFTKPPASPSGATKAPTAGG
jgi:hypothetical protein